MDRLARSIFNIFTALVVLGVALELLRWSFTGEAPDKTGTSVNRMIESLIMTPVKIVAFLIGMVFILVGALLRIPFAIIESVTGIRLQHVVQILSWDDIKTLITDSEASAKESIYIEEQD